MSPEKNIEQQNISLEQVKPIEKSVEPSLDSAKMEQILKPQVQEKSDDDQMAAQVVIPDDKTQVVAPINSEIVHKKVEDILSHDMDSVFLSLDAGTQKVFKIKGEEASQKITSLLMQTKVKAKEITMLILEWLRVIPQINKHYLEQEAKIKTDNILKIHQQK